MHHSVLNLTELKEFLTVEHLQERNYEEEFIHIKEYIEHSKVWERKISVLNHLFSIVLEQYHKKGINNEEAIKFLYNTREASNLVVQEGSLRFLESLFKNDLSSKDVLESEMIKAEQRLYE